MIGFTLVQCTVYNYCTIYTYILQLRNITGARKLGRLKEAVKMFKDLAKEVRNFISSIHAMSSSGSSNHECVEHS